MPETFEFELVSPEKLQMARPAEQAVMPGLEGQFTVLAGHAPMIASLSPGVITVSGGEGEPARLFVKGGLAEVRPDRLIVLAEETLDPADADAAELGREVEKLKASLPGLENDYERRSFEREIAWREALLDNISA